MNAKIIFNLFATLCVTFVYSKQEAWSSKNPQRYSTANFTNAIWYETFATKEIPFTVEYHNGATGKVEIIPIGGRSEKHALKTQKTNDKGYIVIRFKKQIPVKKNDKLQFNAFYQGKENSALYSKAMLRLQTSDQKDFKLYSFYPGINGGDRMQEIISTPPNTWERKFTQRKGEANIKYFEPTLILSGAPSVAIWDDFYIEDDKISAQNWNNFFNKKKPIDRTSEMISLSQLDKIIAQEKDHTGKVVSIDGKSKLLIDGVVSTPIINGPYGAFLVGKTYSNVKDFGAIDVNLTKVSIRLGEGFPQTTYRGCWTGKDQFNLSGAIEQIKNALRLNPKAKIILSITLHPYYKFTEDYPTEAWISKLNTPVRGSGIHINENLKSKVTAKNYIWPSYHSEILKAQYKEQISKIINQLKATKLSKFVVGVHIGGGHDNQMVTTHFDYSHCAVKAFRKYLTNKYKTNQALQQAWNNKNVTFQTAKAPKFQSSKDCFDPKTEQDKIDFFTFSKFAGWQIADEIAEHSRKIINKDIFTMRWCMGPYAGNPGASLDIYNFLTQQKFDVLVAQSSYNMRPPSSPSVSTLPLDSFHLHNKLFTNEFDIRTWNAAPSWEKEIMSITWGLMIDYPMWQAANRKLAGAMFAKDMGFWYLDMAPGWFNHPQILNDIKEVAQIGQKIATMKKSNWQSDTAFIIDDEGMFLRNLPSPEWMFDVTMLIPEQMQLLGSSSIPFARYCLNDLIANPKLAQKFKVLIFAGMYNIDAKRQKLLDSLKNANRTLIFLSGTGRLGGAKTGSTIEVKVSNKRIVDHTVIAEKGIKLNVLSPWMNKRDVHPQKKPAWYDPMFVVSAIPQSNDKIVARFKCNNEPAILERQYANWKAVYIGESGGLSPEYLNILAKKAGAYTLCETGFQCKTNGNFMMVHALKNGQTTFNLPFKCNVTNLYNNKVYLNTTKIKVNAQAGSTYYFILEPTK